jgi:hypothetical protein
MEKYQSQVRRTGQLSHGFRSSEVPLSMCGRGGMWLGIPRVQVTGTGRDILESI